jgi:hypothetical protein
MGLREIKKELQNFEKPQLIELILELYGKDKTTKDYMNFFMNPDEEALLEKFKERVAKPFAKPRGYRIKTSAAKSALTEFKKYGVTPTAIVRLNLYFVEAGIERTLSGGTLRPPIYRALAAAYHTALVLIDKEGLHKDFKENTLSMVQDAWRFDHDFYHALKESYRVNFHAEPPQPKTK